LGKRAYKEDSKLRLEKGDRLEEIDTNLLGKKVWILLQGGYHRIGILKHITPDYLVVEEEWEGQKSDVIVGVKEIIKVELFKEKRFERR